MKKPQPMVQRLTENFAYAAMQCVTQSIAHAELNGKTSVTEVAEAAEASANAMVAGWKIISAALTESPEGNA